MPENSNATKGTIGLGLKHFIYIDRHLRGFMSQISLGFRNGTYNLGTHVRVFLTEEAEIRA